MWAHAMHKIVLLWMKEYLLNLKFKNSYTKLNIKLNYFYPKLDNIIYYFM
jgi:hypothetical protein